LGKADPTDSVVSLPDGKELRPDDLNLGEIVTNFRENRPLVFLNCCHSGVTTPGLTGLGGWAASLIGLGCGAVIGCGWAVVDELAAKFSLAFYDSWRAGNDLSGAVLDARRVTKETAPGNPTWLAYYLFGNPYCTIRSRRNVRP
jgi:CHAT domain-containing protein